MKYINNKTLLALLSMSLLIESCKQKNDEAEPIAEAATIESQVQLTDSQLKSAELETIKLVSKNSNISLISQLKGIKTASQFGRNAKYRRMKTKFKFKLLLKIEKVFIHYI